MKKNIVNIIIVFLIIFIFINVFKIFIYFYNTNKSKETFENLSASVHNEPLENKEKPIDNDKNDNTEIDNINHMLEQNEDMLGWIYIDKTTIDYPVMNSDKYLYKDFNGNYSISGTPFVDKIPNINNGANINIIHGHNMNNGTMFNPLLNYLDEDFFNNHKNIKFYTKDTEKLYEVYAVISLDVSKPQDVKFYDKINIEDDEDFKKYIKEIDKKAILKSNNLLENKRDIIALSTCDNYKDENRIVVLAIEKKS
nr:class B sortase [uncultured Tyzzerella sp.]